MREGASKAGAISRCKSGPGKVVAGRLEASVAWRQRRTRSLHSGCVGCGSEPRNDLIAGAETVFMVERYMCDAVMRGIVVPLGSRATSRAQGARRKLGYLMSGRQMLSERDGPHREDEES